MRVEVGDVVQFTESHQWCGALGIVSEIKKPNSGIVRYMICTPIPLKGGAYVFATEGEFEFIGRAVLVPRSDNDEKYD